MEPFAVDPTASEALSREWNNDVAVLVHPENANECYAVVTFPAPRHSGGVRSMLVDADYPERLYRNRFTVDANGYVPAVHQSLVRVRERSLSVDHIDRIRLDNRRKNLREATQSEQIFNQRQRADRSDYADVCSTLGICEMPRYFRWDGVENKFSFKDHPLAKAAARRGIHVNTSGTKSESVSFLNKFRSALLAALEMFQKMSNYDDMDVADELYHFRIRLALEYNDAVRTAHRYKPDVFPDGPYADMDSYTASKWREVESIRSVLDVLPPMRPDETLGGPRCLEQDVFVDEDGTQAVACFKGADADGEDDAWSSYPIVWDIKHHDALRDLTIDRGDLRIHLTTPLRQRFGLDTTRFPGRKMHAFDLVYHVLENQPARPGFVVVPYNQIKRDLRVANLCYVRGESKNFKPSTPVQEPSPVDIGMPFLPRGVSVFFPDAATNPDRFEFHVRPTKSFLRTDGAPPAEAADKKPKRFTAYKSNGNAKRVFDNVVQPLLREADPEYPQKNAAYQKLLVEYHALAAIRQR